MATTEVRQLLREVTGGYPAGKILRYLNVSRTTPLPDWIVEPGRSIVYNGPVPDDVTTFDCAEKPMDFTPQKPKPALRKDAVKRRYGFVLDSQLTEAIDRLSFPKGRIMARTDGALFGHEELERFQEWPVEALERYDESLWRVFPALKRR